MWLLRNALTTYGVYPTDAAAADALDRVGAEAACWLEPVRATMYPTEPDAGPKVYRVVREDGRLVKIEHCGVFDPVDGPLPPDDGYVVAASAAVVLASLQGGAAWA